MKKILAIILVLACVLSLCACGGTGGSGDEGGKTAEGKVKLSIGIPTSAMVLDHDNNALTNWIEKECNVELTFIEYAGGTDVATQITTTVAARQELPDILFGIALGDAAITRYGKDGYLKDLKPYYENKEMSKIFWDRMENELTEVEREHVLNTITDAETGGIYCVPTVETSLIDKMDTQAWINQEWLDKLQMEAPTNTDELLAFLRAVKKTDLNGNGIADEIPLFGTSTGRGSKPISWILNMFMYYNDEKPYNIGKDGKAYATYTSDAYREGLKFANTLYKEGLLTSMAWTANGSEMKQIVTSSTGTAMAGIFLTHLTTGTAIGSEVLYQYVPLKPFWNVIRHNTSCTKATFITEDCDNPEKAFEMLMTMWSWDGSMRIRYGEYGVNWTDPDPGAKSDIGLDATYKLLNDPLGQQGTAKWAKIASTLNICAEGETAQVSEDTNPWIAKRSAMHAESYALFNAREAEQDNSEACPTLKYTVEEDERLSQYRTNVGDRRSKARTEFITGVMDPFSDADWNSYLKQMDDLGEKIIIEGVQTAYNRSVDKK